MESLYPLLFKPNLREVVWGGNRLKPLKGMPADGVPIGESWEVSSLPERESIVSNGPLAGRRLNDLTGERTEQILGQAVARKYGNRLPLLVKLIDARQDLSIQVHPNDAMAQRLHGTRGKTEMWYIIGAEPGASVLAGFSRPLTPQKYAQSVEDGTICDYLARHSIRPGDAIYIPAGRVHAICGGTQLVEVQESSDVTYRIYDYNRPGIDGKPRELHTDLAAQTINYEDVGTRLIRTPAQPDQVAGIIRSPFFNINILQLTRPIRRKMLQHDTFVILVCIQGSVSIEPRIEGSSSAILAAGSVDVSALVPAAVADYDLVPLTPETRILEAYIDFLVDK